MWRAAWPAPRTASTTCAGCRALARLLDKSPGTCGIISDDSLVGSLISARKSLMGGSQLDEARLFLVVPSDRKMGNVHKLKCRKFHLNTGKKFFTVRVTKHWNSCPERLWSLLWRDLKRSWTLSCVFYRTYFSRRLDPEIPSSPMML